MSAPVLYESHCHTPLCHHAYGEPGEYAAVAQARGLKGLIVTCHCPLPDGISADVRMSPAEFPVYVDLVARAREEWAGRVDVRLGLESDYYPGVEPWLEKLHARVPLHHVLGSVHYHVPEYRARHNTGDAFAYQQLYYEHLAEAAETGLYDTLAHPDLIKNDAPAEWHLPRILPFIARSLDRIAATGVAMELNTSGLDKALPEMNPGPVQLALMHERGIPVVIGADAHRPGRVGDRYPAALGLLRDAGYTEVSFFLDRQRQTVPIDIALASLRVPESASLAG
jgi:histidinol-phosphatase (PHP family)